MAKKVYRSQRFWNKVKEEYMEGKDPKAVIAARHGITVNSMNNRLRTEHWAQEKEERNKQKEHEKIAEAESVAEIKPRYDATNQMLCEDIGNTLLRKIAMSCDAIDISDRAGIRQLTASLKDLKELRLWADTLNEIEQKARIKKLQKEADEETKTFNLNVSFAEDVEEIFNGNEEPNPSETTT